jgi:hypothetical protein
MTNFRTEADPSAKQRIHSALLNKNIRMAFASRRMLVPLPIAAAIMLMLGASVIGNAYWGFFRPVREQIVCRNVYLPNRASDPAKEAAAMKKVADYAASQQKTADLMGGEKPFFTFESQRTGFLVMSYRPFSGAVAAGYFEDKKLIFEWNGDTYKWLSMDKPFLPEGRWAAYFWQAALAFPASDKEIGVGGFEADPDELQVKVNQMIEMRKSASTIKTGPIL